MHDIDFNDKCTCLIFDSLKHLDHDTEHGETKTETVEEMGTHSEETVIILGFPYDETAELEIITTEKEPQTILTTGPLDDKPPTSPSEKTSGTLMDTNSIINPALRKWVSSSPNISSKKRFSPAEGWRCTGCDELASKVKKLEETVAKLVAEKPSILNPSQFTEMTDPKTPPKSKSVTKKTIWHSAKKGAHTQLQLDGTYCGEFCDTFNCDKHVTGNCIWGRRCCL